MKRTIAAAALLLMLLPLCAQKKDGDAEDPLKGLLTVEKPVAVPDPFKTGYNTITIDEGNAFLRFISSDLLAGRDTGEPGLAIASEFAAALFASFGLLPAGDFEPQPSRGMFGPIPSENSRNGKRSFLQAVPLREKLNQTNQLSFTQSIDGAARSIRPTEDIDYFLHSATDIDMEAQLVFVGYGLDVPEARFTEFKGVDVKGKIVIMIEGKPEHEKDKKRMALIEKTLANSASPMMRRRSLTSQFRAAQKAGAIGVITVNPDTDTWLTRLKPKAKQADSRPIIERKSRSISLALDEGMSMPWEVIPRISLSPQIADELLKPYGHTLKSLKQKIDADLKPASFSLSRTRGHISSVSTEKQFNCRNVLAYIEGSDPELKNEWVVVGGHLDHLGQSGPYIFNGADDNGSGAVVVLQTAKAMMMNEVKPKRSVLFALWTGEEKGLLGSRYYIAHPYASLKKTVAYLNIDMASRLWDKKSLGRMARMMRVPNVDALLEKIDIDKFATFSYYESEQTEAYLKRSNESVGLQLLLRGTRNSMGGSDHWPFGNANIPWVFFNTAMTEDYHQPGDEIENCSLELMQKIAQLCYLTTMQMAE